MFVPHWADGDLLVGDTLIDVKTVLRADDPGKVGPWLWQVLAYAWLDSRSDHYRIRAVGLYLSRHGVLLRWPVDALAARLLAHPKTGAPGSGQCVGSSSRSRPPRPPATAPRSRCAAATPDPSPRPATCPATLSGLGARGWPGRVGAGCGGGPPGSGGGRGGRLVGWWPSALWTWRVSSGARHEWIAQRSAERAGASGR
ncbi:hypothetical protein ACFPM0_36005 [Pseudonocardia sulfidoxydans]|uniref:hypothetical protein n=1 Tax=Pseudonocardia sulfidoxydans TaxID=54011 RepID=UPI0036235A7E